MSADIPYPDPNIIAWFDFRTLHENFKINTMIELKFII